MKIPFLVLVSLWFLGPLSVAQPASRELTPGFDPQECDDLLRLNNALAANDAYFQDLTDEGPYDHHNPKSYRYLLRQYYTGFDESIF